MFAVDQVSPIVSTCSSAAKYSVAGQTMPQLVDFSACHSPCVDPFDLRRYLSHNHNIPCLSTDLDAVHAAQLKHHYSTVFEAALTKMLMLQQTPDLLEHQQNQLLCPQRLTLPTAPASCSPNLLLDTIDQAQNRYRCLHCGLADQDKFTVQFHMIKQHSDVVNAPIDTSIYSSAQHIRSSGNVFDQFGSSPPLSASANAISAPHQHLPLMGNVWATQADVGLATSLVVSQSKNLYQEEKALGVVTANSGSSSRRGSSPMDVVRCEMCGKYLSCTKPMSSLLNHAKRHNVLKQFVCICCPYGSSEAAHVRNHMKLRHRIVGREPLDNRNPMLQDAWIRITVRCFPTMVRELSRFRFKNFRKKNQSAESVISMTTEDDPNSPHSSSSVDIDAHSGAE